MSTSIRILFVILLAVVSCGKPGGEKITLSVTPTTLSAPYTASSQTFEVVSNGEWKLKALSAEGYDIAWAKPNRTNGNGNMTVSIRVYENEYYEGRSAQLVVTSATGQKETVALTQNGNPTSDKHNQVQIRAGQYNLRGDWASDKNEHAWENRKTRLVRSIKDCDFDIFGVDEFGLKTQAYFKAEIGDTYEIQVFSPYHQNGVGDHACGIIYKKSLALKEFHYFWMADPPELVHILESGASASPACCGVFVHKETGIEFYFMATHTNRDNPLEWYNEWEQKYNPSGNAAFLVGDFNMRPNEERLPIILQHWGDAYADAPVREGLYTTYNAFNMARDMTIHASRIDYVFYRNATPVRYMNFDTRVYDGYYASDHMPIYCDMIRRPGEKK